MDLVNGLRSRGQTYAFILGAVASLLIAGLLVPLVFGHRTGSLLGGATGATVNGGSPGTTPGSTGGTNPTGDNPGPGGLDAAPGPLTGAPGGAPGIAGSGVSPMGGGGTALLGGAGAPFSPAGRAAGPGPAGRSASDQGVTATTVRLGIELVDFGGANTLGAGVAGYDTKAQKMYYDRFIDDVNAHGGAGGRRIEPRYYTVDILNPSTFTAACNQLIDGDHVFAVTNVLGVYGDPILCVTRQHKTPYLAVDGAISDYYPASQGLLFTVGQSTLRTISNMAYELIRSGEIKGKTVGLLNEGEYLHDDFAALVDYLKSQNVKVVQQEIAAVDTSKAAIQLPAAVQAFRAAGVNYVLLMTNSLYATQFVQDAEPTGFPAYAESDFDYEMAGDSFLSQMPADYFRHAVSITASRVGEYRVNLPEPGPDHDCAAVYGGEKPTPRSDSNYLNALAACDLVRLFTTGFVRAGLNPTRQTFAKAIASLGKVNLAGVGAASFGPGKTDAPDAVRMDVAYADCKCWKPQTGFVPAHFGG